VYALRQDNIQKQYKINPIETRPVDNSDEAKFYTIPPKYIVIFQKE